MILNESMEPTSPVGWIWSRTHRASGKIVEVDELWGQTRYRIWLPSLNPVLLPQEEGKGEEEQKTGVDPAGSREKSSTVTKCLDMV
ncbi:MAG: hypothetical protein ORN51_06510 [Akkermansiaceae bacterium]|nr:hypothetical protein [Akkermansiaceae bacterium]